MTRLVLRKSFWFLNQLVFKHLMTKTHELFRINNFIAHPFLGGCDIIKLKYDNKKVIKSQRNNSYCQVGFSLKTYSLKIPLRHLFMKQAWNFNSSDLPRPDRVYPKNIFI